MAERIELWPLERLKPYEKNARTHSPAQVDKLVASIREFGFTNPILVDGNDGIIAGHGRLIAARQADMKLVPVVVLTHLTDAQRRAYVIADNRLALDAGWDDDLLAAELSDLQDHGYDLELTGFNDDEIADLLDGLDDDEKGTGAGTGEPEKGSMADKFIVPPFSVMNAREGWWQDRKRAWIAQGIKSELGRGDNMLGFSAACNIQQGGGKAYDQEAKSKFGKCLETGIGDQYGREEMNGTIIFDPVLCEIAYRWFSPVGGTILDPFAGGSVRGIVAAKLGRQYIGGELRAEQVEANRAQGDAICTDDDPVPVWHCADSRLIDKTCAGVEADMVFSCPPYADLEVYSDDPDDLSTLGYDEFIVAYREIIARSCSLLRMNRFACFVVGDVRDKAGMYYNFVSDTIAAFLDAGLRLYNEAILVTAVGSLPIRAGKQFSASRKLGKTHQNVLVFVKGDPKLATLACGAVDVTLPEGFEDAAANENSVTPHQQEARQSGSDDGGPSVYENASGKRRSGGK